jgi:hypothetical protein
LRFDSALALTLAAVTLLALMPVSAHADDAGQGTVDLGAAAEPEPKPEAPPPEVARRAGVGSQMFDVLLLRPLGALATLSGAVFFAISVPLVAPSKNIDVTRDIFLFGPYDYTFKRPLGEF